MHVYRCECVNNFQCREICVEGARKFGPGINIGILCNYCSHISFVGLVYGCSSVASGREAMRGCVCVCVCVFNVPLVHALAKAESIVEGNALVAGANHEPVLVRYIFYVADDSRANIFLRY